jgi:hypothetical protein
MLTHERIWPACLAIGSSRSAAYRIVLVHHPLLLDREDAFQVFLQAGIKAISGCTAATRNSGELGDVALAQKAVGLLRGGDAAQPQLLRQPPLPGAEVTLAASARLRRCGPRLGALLTSPAACGSSLMQV